MIVKSMDGRIVDISQATGFLAINKEETKKLTESYNKMLLEQKARRAVPVNNYNIRTIKKILNEHGFGLISWYGGYKGGRYAPRQKYNVVELDTNEEFVYKGLNYYELGGMLEELGWYTC